MKKIVLKLDAKPGRARMFSDDMQVFDAVRDRFTIVNKAAKYSSYSSDTISAITPLGTFPVGLSEDIAWKASELGIFVEMEDSLKETLKPLNIVYAPPPPENGDLAYRDYQSEAISAALATGRGIVKLPTGSGKSLVLYGLVRAMREENLVDKPILVITPNVQLVVQLSEDMISYGMDREKIKRFSSSCQEIPTSDVWAIVSNRQWLEEHGEDLSEIGAVIVDECHGLRKGNAVTDFVKKLKTNIKIGLTATIPDGAEDEWCVKGTLGPILSSREISELQDSGVLSSIKIVPVKITHAGLILPKPKNVEEWKKAYSVECEAIESNLCATAAIGALASALPGNTILLFDHTEFGKSIFAAATKNRKHFINGEIDVDSRELARKDMEANGDVLIIGNARCFGEGINIKRVNNIVLAMNGRSSVKVLQTVGRGLRLHSSKDHTNLIDIHHTFKYSESHYRERRKIYEKNYRVEVPECKVLTVNSSRSMSSVTDL